MKKSLLVDGDLGGFGALLGAAGGLDLDFLGFGRLFKIIFHDFDQFKSSFAPAARADADRDLRF